MKIQYTAEQIRARRERLQRRLEIKQRRETLPIYNVVADNAAYRKRQHSYQVAAKIAAFLETVQVDSKGRITK